MSVCDEPNYSVKIALIWCEHFRFGTAKLLLSQFQGFLTIGLFQCSPNRGD